LHLDARLVFTLLSDLAQSQDPLAAFATGGTRLGFEYPAGQAGLDNLNGQQVGMPGNQVGNLLLPQGGKLSSGEIRVQDCQDISAQRIGD
jgi:hypothetical protein